LEHIQWPSEKRATHYRAQAQSLRDLANAEPIGSLRTSLSALAQQYDSLSASIEAKDKKRSYRDAALA